MFKNLDMSASLKLEVEGRSLWFAFPLHKEIKGFSYWVGMGVVSTCACPRSVICWWRVRKSQNGNYVLRCTPSFCYIVKVL